ncbi:MAG: histidine kinase [Gammaproteobacteria bacterium]|nr:histidine kinase [Gammaproteobacteria bacterium]
MGSGYRVDLGRVVRPRGRRSLPRVLLELGGTVLFCLGVAAVLTVTFPFWTSLVVSLCIGLSIHGLAEGLGRLLGDRASLITVMVVAVPAGIFLGYLLSELLLTGQVTVSDILQPRSLLLGGLFGLLGATLFILGSSVENLRDSLRDAQLERLAGEKSVIETELRLLQAQIEPHFLFNTLSNVLALLRTDADAAGRVLEQLTRLLRVSLQRTRHQSNTLAEELELVQAYLAIAEVRMGSRLRWRIDVAEELRDQVLPPLLLQPLVENAMQHGIDPLPEGGSVEVQARRDGEDLLLCVRDDGVGLLDQPDGAGVALDNIRRRLRGLYGDGARLDLLQRAPRGTEARLRLPTWAATAGGDP